MSDSDSSSGTIRVNGLRRTHTPGSVVELLMGLELDPNGRGLAVAINGEIVSRGDWEIREIREGDEIEVVGAVQGG